MKEPDSLSFQEQLDLLSQRGMNVSNRDLKKLEHISYYRFKEFAKPLSRTKRLPGGNLEVSYTNVSFGDVLTRFYQDKNLRIHLLHAIEKIEVSIKTKTSYILGNKYGAFGYLDFSVWCNRKKFKRFEIEKRQYFFKKSLKNSIARSYSSDVRDKRNQDSEGFPTVWLAIDVLTFGELVRLIEVMSNKNQKDLASFYNCSAIELISWLKCIHFVRNVCAHNANIIDIKLKTTPLYRDEWKENLFQLGSGNNKRPSNRLAVVIFILYHLVSNINGQYGWKNINRSIHALCSGKEKNSELLGFSSLSAALSCIPKNRNNC